MKTINSFLVLLMLAVPFAGFTGCRDDKCSDDGYIEAITGTYSGEIRLFDMLSFGSIDIPVAKEDDNHVSMNVDINRPVGGNTTFGVSGRFVNEVSYSSGRYTLKGDTETVGIVVAQHGIMPSEIRREVTVGGYIEGNTANLTITLPLPEEVLTGLADAVADENLKAQLKAFIKLLPGNNDGDKPVGIFFSGTKALKE
jgi:hypothetical protein